MADTESCQGVFTVARENFSPAKRRHPEKCLASGPTNGEISPDDAACEADPTAGSGTEARVPKRHHRSSDEQLTLNHLVEYNHSCLKAFRAQEKKVYEIFHTKLRRLVTPRLMPAVWQNESALTSLQILLEEASSLAEAASRGGRASMAPLRADWPGLSQPGMENLEREAQEWWQNTTEKFDRKIADHSTAMGKAFIDRLGSALAQRDSEASPQLVEILRPLQQRVEQCIQAELRESATTAGARQLRSTFRDGGGAMLLPLATSVNSSMAKAKSQWSDEKIRKAAERQRASTEVVALTAPASQEAVTAVCDTIRAMAIRSPAFGPSPESGAGLVPNKRGDTTSRSLASSLLARVREDTRLLDADLHALTSDAGCLKQAVAQCGEVVGQLESKGCLQPGSNDGQSASAMSSAIRLASTQAELRTLIKDAKFEDAFDQALRWDAQTQAQLLTEEICNQVLDATDSDSPEAFLTLDNGPRLPNDRLRLLLMANLSQRITAEETSVKQAESNLEWVMCLQEHFDFKPSVSETFGLVAGPMSDCLSAASQGRAPPSLSSASPEDKQRVATNAKLALKQLKMFQRRAPPNLLAK